MHCSTWIRHFLCQLVYKIWTHHGDHMEPAYLSDDVIVDILSRLPTDEVLKCRRVCKNWRALTSTLHFTEIHAKRVNDDPMIFLQYLPPREGVLEFSLVDEKLEKECMIDKRACTSFMKKANLHHEHPRLVNSCDGLLVFSGCSKFIICNPVMQGIVTLLKPDPWVSTVPLGIFFHSTTREYRLLFSTLKSCCNEYFVTSLGSQIWRRVGALRPQNPHHIPVALDRSLHRSLYWVNYSTGTCANSIVAFNIDSEQLNVLPHPGHGSSIELCQRRLMALFKMERDRLAFCFYLTNKVVIWLLKDHEKWSWDNLCEIKLDDDLYRLRVPDRLRIPPIVAIQDKEALFVWAQGMFQYNLQTRKLRKLQFKEFMLDESKNVAFTSYTKSLISLKDLCPAYFLN